MTACKTSALTTSCSKPSVYSFSSSISRLDVRCRRPGQASCPTPARSVGRRLTFERRRSLAVASRSKRAEQGAETAGVESQGRRSSRECDLEITMNFCGRGHAMREHKTACKTKWNWNKTVSKLLYTCFVSVSFRCADSLISMGSMQRLHYLNMNLTLTLNQTLMATPTVLVTILKLPTVVVVPLYPRGKNFQFSIIF